MATAARIRPEPMDFYEREVMPALYERLDQAFPEFAWTWTGRDWVSSRTGDDPTAPRIRCASPREFYVEGGGKTSWLAYVNGGSIPRGRDLSRAIGALAALARVNGADVSAPRVVGPSLADRKERTQRMMEVFLRHSQRALNGPAGEQCRAYLKYRWGLPVERLAEYPLGCYTTRNDVHAYLREHGFEDDEIEESFLTADSRCAGRLLVPVRGADGELTTLVAQRVGPLVEDEPRYLHLKGGRLPAAFGLDVALSRSARGCEHLVLVADRLEAVAFQGAGPRNVAAIGARRERLSVKRWEQLRRLGARRVTLALSGDDAADGRLLSHIDRWARAESAPRLAILDPDHLVDHDSWWSLFREAGREAFEKELREAYDALRFRARHIVGAHRRGGAWSDARREAALAEAHRFASTVPAARHDELRDNFWPVIDEYVPYRSRWADRSGQPPARIPDWEDHPPRIGPAELKRDVESTEGHTDSENDDRKETLTTIGLEIPDHLSSLRGVRERGGSAGLLQKSLPGLDERLSGLRGLTMLTGAPSIGKTSLALQLATDVVLHNADACALVVSFDTNRRELLTRIVSRLSGHDWGGWSRRSNSGAADDGTETARRRLERAEKHLTDIGERVVIIDGEEARGIDVERLLRQLRRLRARAGSSRSLVVVDDLQGWPSDGHGDSEKRGDRRVAACLRRLRDAVEVDALLAPCAADSSINWTGVPLASVADCVCLLGEPTDEELLSRVGRCRFPTVVLSRWRRRWAEQGVAPRRLTIAKSRDGGRIGSLDLEFRYRVARFEQGDTLFGQSLLTGALSSGSNSR